MEQSYPAVGAPSISEFTAQALKSDKANKRKKILIILINRSTHRLFSQETYWLIASSMVIKKSSTKTIVFGVTN